MKIDYFFLYYTIMVATIMCFMGYVILDEMKFITEYASNFCENRTGIYNLTLPNGNVWENLNCTYINEHGIDVYAEIVIKPLFENVA